MTDKEQANKKSIRLWNAVALYASSVLGSGILVLPGLTAQLAGPASILAWMLLAIASLPFAMTFASLSAKRKESVGVYSFAKEGFGKNASIVTGWLIYLWDITGAPAVAVVAASYLGYSFHLSRPEEFLIAAALVLVAVIVNYLGIVFSNRVQFAAIASVVALLIVTIAVSSFYIRPSNFQPFLPSGFIPVGSAAALIFWSFLGYENVSNVASEFENPERDFRRSVVLSVILISVLYVLVSFVTVGTAAYKSGGSVAPFAAILSHTLGAYAGIATGVLALFIIFSTVNAYTTGMSWVFKATAKDGGFPSIVAHTSRRTRSASGALSLMLVGYIPVFLIYYVYNIDLNTAFLVSGGAAIMIYIIGFAAAFRIVRKDRSIVNVWLPIVSFVMSVIIIAFVGLPILISIITVVAAIAYISVGSRHKRRN